MLAAAARLGATPVPIDIPAGDLGAGLVALSQQTGLSIGIAGALPHHAAGRVRGHMEPSAALMRLLRGSGLRAVRADGLWRLEHVPPPDSPMPGARAAIMPAPADIVVTATKRDERLGDAPIALSVIRPDMADRMTGGRGLHDAIGGTEGAFATNLGPGRDRIFLRGVADSAFNGPTQGTVSLLIDDARVSYTTPDPDLRLVDIDRIELLRGPQGTLYGTGALGGIIRIIPAKPDLHAWSGMAAIEAGRVAHGAAGGAVELVVNAPLARDRVGLRLAGYVDRTGGWIDDDGRAVGRSAHDVNAVRRLGGRGALRWRIASDWTVDLGLVVQLLDARDSQYATGAAGRGLHRATRLAEPHDNDFLAPTMTVTGRVGGLDFTSATAFVAHEVGSDFDASAVAGARGLAAPLRYDEARVLHLATQEWRLSDRGAGRPWVAGIALLRAQTRFDGDLQPPAAPSVAIAAQHDASTEAALFGEATQAIAAGLDFTAGLRGFASRVDNEQAGRQRRRVHAAGITPSATLAWKAPGHGLVWLRYASAIRPGGINPDGDPGAKGFRSDDLDSLELGWRLRGLGDRVQMTGALFALRWKNVQSDVIGADSLVRTINAGEARNAGIEIGSIIDLRPFAIETSFTAQHARLYRPSAAANGVGDDNRLPVLPDFAGRIKVALDRPVFAIPAGWFVAARYLGRARLSFDPAVARSMGGYWVADAGVTIGGGPWRGAITVANLLDGQGDSFGFGNPFTFHGVDQRTPIAPRTVSLRIERRF